MTPHPSIAALEPLIGRWRIGAPGAPASGDVEFAWLGDKEFDVERWRRDPPEIPDGTSILAPDESGEGCVQHCFGRRGVERRYGMSLRDGEWRLWRDAPDFSQRFTGTFSADGTTITGAWEMARDGKTFELDFDLAYTRLDAHAP